VILAVTGLRREARIVRGPGVLAIASGGHAKSLREKFDQAVARGVKGVISFGIAAALSPELHTGDIVIGAAVVTPRGRITTDPAWRQRLVASLPMAKLSLVAGTDALLMGRDSKATLFAETGADAADMESGPVSRLALARNLPFACLRVISDDAMQELPPAAAVALNANGGVDLLALCRSLWAEPNQAPSLMRAASDSRKALGVLLRCRDLVGRGLAGPDLG
jgi:hopanoid-associated phosphorylase